MWVITVYYVVQDAYILPAIKNNRIFIVWSSNHLLQFVYYAAGSFLLNSFLGSHLLYWATKWDAGQQHEQHRIMMVHTNLSVAHLQLKYLLYVKLLVPQCTKSLLSRQPIEIVENHFVFFAEGTEISQSRKIPKCQSWLCKHYSEIKILLL